VASLLEVSQPGGKKGGKKVRALIVGGVRSATIDLRGLSNDEASREDSDGGPLRMLCHHMLPQEWSQRDIFVMAASGRDEWCCWYVVAAVSGLAEKTGATEMVLRQWH